MQRPYSNVTIIGALVAFGFLALAAVLFVSPGPEALQRLALFFGVVGTGVASLVALLKSDEAATQTNGGLDARIAAAVHRANNARRRGDDPDAPLSNVIEDDITAGERENT